MRKPKKILKFPRVAVPKPTQVIPDKRHKPPKHKKPAHILDFFHKAS